MVFFRFYGAAHVVNSMQEVRVDSDGLIQQTRAFLGEHPINETRLRRFLETGGDDWLWSTQDLMEYTGWGRTYISRLCTSGTLPHIPGKPHRFVPEDVKGALRQMQQGGIYGRRKSKMKGKARKNEM
jgi:hypothetical protein